MGGQNVEYCDNKGTKEHEKTNHVHYETCGKKQKYTKEDCSKETEQNCHTKYVTGGGGRVATARSISSARSVRHSQRSAAASASRKSSKAGSGSGGGGGRRVSGSHRSATRSRGTAGGGGSACSVSSAAKSAQSALQRRLSRCYEVKRIGRRNECNKKRVWQTGRYARDQCGSGILPKRYDFEPSRKLWCKTPLTMYQATIGELARKILCREVVIARDIHPEPPSNIAEYILPPCRGYYRKYDCLRPCEEKYATIRAGRTEYRDRVQRYWEPCLSQGQKHQLDVNDYAPQNAFLAVKLRRRNQTNDQGCW